MTFIFRPSARSATSAPMLPQPTRPEHFGVQLGTHEAVLLPAPGLRRGIGRADLAGGGEQQRDCVLRRRDRIAERRIHHDDTARGRRGMSMLSTPMPARPTTLSRDAAAITSLSAFVAERTASPS